MMESHGLREELRELVWSLQAGTSTAAGIARIEELIAGDLALRRFYIEYTRLAADLRLDASPDLVPQTLGRVLQGETTCAPVPLAASENKAQSEPVPASPVLGFLADIGRQGWGFVSEHTSMFALLIGFLMLGAVGTWAIMTLRNTGLARPELAQQETGQPGTLTPQSEITHLKSDVARPHHIAHLARTVDCRWGKGAEPARVGDELTARRQLRLETGLAEIVCPKGVQLLLQGPAVLTVESEQSVYLAEGRLTARLTRPEARGFSIRTAKSVVMDQGTEFGVEVAPGGDENVHVFQGKVQLTVQPEDGRPLAARTLTENQGARIRADVQGASLVADTGESFTRSLDQPTHDPHTVAYWRFEDRPVGTLVPDSGKGTKPVRGTLDCSGNGNDLFTWSVATAPRFSADVAAAAVAHSGKANSGSLDNSAPLDPIGTRDLYTMSLFSHASPLDLQKISPKQWTIEASIKPAALHHQPQVFLGRDGSEPWAAKPLPSRLAFGITVASEVAITFFDADGRLWGTEADRPHLVEGRWHHLAATSDGRALRLYIDANDGQGYKLQATAVLATTGNTALGVGSETAQWSIGRGKSPEGQPAGWFQGWIDEVRISDVAREPSDFLFATPHAPRPKTQDPRR